MSVRMPATQAVFRMLYFSLEAVARDADLCIFRPKRAGPNREMGPGT
jgi:hypothetical protein